MNTQEVKGTLAKLLATENLTVEHRRVSTAAVDVEKRLLVVLLPCLVPGAVRQVSARIVAQWHEPVP